MSFALARSLLLADAVTPEAMAEALLVSATRGTSLVRALLTTRAIDASRLERELERVDAPAMRHVAPVLSLVQQLPPGLCERLLALPVRRDPRTGTIDVAVVDARDPHPVEEMAHWLRAPVRLVRTSLVAMDAALRRLRARPEPSGPRPLAAPIWVPPATEPPRDLAHTPAYGTPVAGAGFLEDEEDGDDGGKTGILDVGQAAPNIPIPLRAREVTPAPIVNVEGAEGERTTEIDVEVPIDLRPRTALAEPVLELRRRKPEMSEPPPAAPPELPDALAPHLDALRAAGDRDAILDAVVVAAHTLARKVAVLALRRDSLVGWTCTPEMGDRAALRTARVPLSLSSTLGGALEAERATLARIPKDATHAPLLATMHVPPMGEVAMVPIRVAGKAVALVIADQLDDARTAPARLEGVAEAAGEALARLLRSLRK